MEPLRIVLGWYALFYIQLGSLSYLCRVSVCIRYRYLVGLAVNLKMWVALYLYVDCCNTTGAILIIIIIIILILREKKMIVYDFLLYNFVILFVDFFRLFFFFKYFFILFDSLLPLVYVWHLLVRN